MLTDIIQFGGISKGKVEIRGEKSVLYIKFVANVGVQCNVKWSGGD